MDISWPGAWVTFQVTFTEFFIASTVFVSVAYTSGWQSAVLGSLLGATAIAIVAAILGTSLQFLPLHVLDWVSCLLLLAFGAYLFYEFIDGLRKKSHEGRDTEPSQSQNLRGHVNWAGVSVAGWAVVAEGLEVLVVWLAIALKKGFPTATAGAGMGVAVILVLALTLGRAGVFRRIPAPVLDGFAAIMVTAYGIYFLIEALRQ